MPIVQANGIDVYDEEAGSGPTLLLLNHEGGTTLDWSSLLPALAPRFAERQAEFTDALLAFLGG